LRWTDIGANAGVNGDDVFQKLVFLQYKLKKN